MKQVAILAIPIQFPTLVERGKLFHAWIWSSVVHHIVTINPEYCVRAHRDASFKRILQDADLRCADGAGIVIMARLLGYDVRLTERNTGVQLTHELLTLASSQNQRVAIILKHNSITDPHMLRVKLVDRYPHCDLFIVREPIDIGQIMSFDPQILFTAQGSPEQDRFISSTANSYPSLRIAIGVGGTFDFISGRMKRAPELLQTLGLEWLWRLILEPRRIMRIINAVIIFPYLAISNK